MPTTAGNEVLDVLDVLLFLLILLLLDDLILPHCLLECVVVSCRHKRRLGTTAQAGLLGYMPTLQEQF